MLNMTNQFRQYPWKRTPEERALLTGSFSLHVEPPADDVVRLTDAVHVMSTCAA